MLDEFLCMLYSWFCISLSKAIPKPSVWVWLINYNYNNSRLWTGQGVKLLSWTGEFCLDAVVMTSVVFPQWERYC